MAVENNLKAILKEKGIRYNDLCCLCNYTVSTATLRNVANNYFNPSPKLALDIAKGLNMKVADIFYLDDETKKEIDNKIKNATNEDIYTPAYIAKVLGLSHMQLRTLEKNKIVIAHRNEKNRRYYTKDQIEEIKSFFKDGAYGRKTKETKNELKF